MLCYKKMPLITCTNPRSGWRFFESKSYSSVIPSRPFHFKRRSFVSHTPLLDLNQVPPCEKRAGVRHVSLNA